MQIEIANWLILQEKRFSYVKLGLHLDVRGQPRNCLMVSYCLFYTNVQKAIYRFVQGLFI